MGRGNAARAALLQHLHSEQSHDVKLASSDGEVHTAHKVILSIHSEFFRNSFLDTWWASREGTPITVDCTASQLHQLIKYFYTGDLTDILQTQDLVEFIIIGRQLLIDDLVEELVPHVVAAVDADNACSLLSLAHQLHLKRLKERCAMFVIQKLSNVERSECYECLGRDTRRALKSLGSLYSRCVAANGPVYTDLRELLGMLKEALQEAEETYEVGKARNVEEIRTWEAAVRSNGAGKDGICLDSMCNHNTTF